MSDEVANLILENLRRLHGKVDVIGLDVTDSKVRMSSVEAILGQQQVQLAALNGRMDRFDDRLSRIERRLDLVEA